MLDLATEFEKLAQGNAIWVTASNRQSRFWLQEYHEYQSQSRPAWPSPRIVPWSAWTRYLLNQCAYHQSVPTLLTSAQSLWLWDEIIKQSQYADWLISSQQTAAKAYEGWQQLQQWQLPLSKVLPESVDHEAFIQWAHSYEQQLEQHRWLDEQQLNGWLASKAQQLAIEPHQSIAFIGFHQKTPAQESLMKRAAETAPSIVDTLPTAEAISFGGQQFNQFDDECRGICDWLLEQLERKPDGQFAVVVPDLDKKRQTVAAILREHLHPETLSLPLLEVPLFNISVGVPLRQFPFVRHTLCLLKLMAGSIEQDELAELLKSSFIFMQVNERNLCRSLAYQLPDMRRQQWTLKHLLHWLSHHKLAEQLSTFIELLTELVEQTDYESALLAPELWAAEMTQWLQRWQWPGHTTSSSVEYQLYQQLVEQIKLVRQLHHLQSETSFKTVIRFLEGQIEGQVFQAKSAGEPIQILGLYEAVGLRFDGLWISGLSNEVLPEAPAANSFLPLSLVRQNQMPGAGPERELEYAKTLLGALTQSSEQVVMSYFAGDGDRELGPCRLTAEWIEHWSPKEVDSRPLLSVNEIPYEWFNDGVGWRYEESLLKGGSSFIQAQFLCPFKAYMEFRLGIREQEQSGLGIDARDRGHAVHKALQILWEQLQRQSTLLQMSEEDLLGLVDDTLQSVVDYSVSDSKVERRLEIDRCREVILELFELEKQRPGFQVIERESAVNIQIQGMTISGRIDRIDQIDSGQKVIVDYKTGSPKTSLWFSERLGDAQLPLYALSDKDNVGGLCFARLKPREVGFAGVTEETDWLPGVKTVDKQRVAHPPESWNDFLQQVESKLHVAITEIQDGEASVTPARTLNACNFCPYDSVCRINEVEQSQEASL
ncbi:PD-(D/E)XK nuclease family protein [Pleionea sp. CnH1-48]|uniref:PD-(D/E)XK nuclease family protein n=1 Tax=Pleionea sp. CnH1-48 TaxID=2954494 RepID=UPI002097DD15|nr:PD-(D/E)XK nuclease family protein [Pleionea sp. CnH1-48]MCO7223912.1 PD-(D/E)XK nuclease family protein [Pleionea sp. CnH1-48]